MECDYGSYSLAKRSSRRQHSWDHDEDFAITLLLLHHVEIGHWKPVRILHRNGLLL